MHIKLFIQDLFYHLQMIVKIEEKILKHQSEFAYNTPLCFNYTSFVHHTGKITYYKQN